VGVPSSPRVPATAAAVEIPAKLAEFGFLELTPEWLDPGFLWWGKMGFLIDKKYGLLDLLWIYLGFNGIYDGLM
jgi:hypothetical protein